MGLGAVPAQESGALGRGDFHKKPELRTALARVLRERPRRIPGRGSMLRYKEQTLTLSEEKRRPIEGDRR